VLVGCSDGGDTGEGPADSGPGNLVRPQVIEAWNGGWVAIRTDRTGILLGPEAISAVAVVGSDEIQNGSRTAAVPAGGLG